jgi:hypothetical protein
VALEVEGAARYLAQRGRSGDVGDALPAHISMAARRWIGSNLAAFKAKVRRHSELAERGSIRGRKRGNPGRQFCSDEYPPHDPGGCPDCAKRKPRGRRRPDEHVSTYSKAVSLGFPYICGPGKASDDGKTWMAHFNKTGACTGPGVYVGHDGRRFVVEYDAETNPKRGRQNPRETLFRELARGDTFDFSDPQDMRPTLRGGRFRWEKVSERGYRLIERDGQQAQGPARQARLTMPVYAVRSGNPGRRKGRKRANPGECPICGQPAGSPYRSYDSRGKVVQGCVSEFHTGHLVTPSETAFWHSSTAAKKVRATNKRAERALR